MDIQSIINTYNDYVIEKRRYFHAHPEPSKEEFQTSKSICEELTRLGIQWKKCGTTTSILATIEGSKPGKTILLRGDIDALQVKELNTCEYKSCNEGLMHACGHDCHISMLLTAAHILNDHRNEIEGTVKFIFQSAEEIAFGARDAIADGVLNGVDAVFGIHIWSDVEAGQVSVPAGPRMASADQFFIRVTGKGGHGAQPHQCIDAITTSAAIISNLQTIVSRQIAPTDTAVLTIGTIQAGTRFNVVAEKAVMEGTTRCFSNDVRNNFEPRMRRIIESTAASFGAKGELEYNYLLAPTINDKAIALCAQKASESIFGANWESNYGTTMGAEDFSEYLKLVPGAIALLGCASDAADSRWPQHSGHYKVDESVLVKGALLYAQTALNFLNS